MNYEFSICLVITYCWAIESKLLTTQYNTRPAGNHRKKMVNTTGINCITRACIGSGGVGLSFIWKNIELPIINGRINYGSITGLSVILKMNVAGHSSTDSIIT